MLREIDPLLGPDLLPCCAPWGHGDKIAVVDADYPAADGAKQLGGPRGLMRCGWWRPNASPSCRSTPWSRRRRCAWRSSMIPNRCRPSVAHSTSWLQGRLAVTASVRSSSRNSTPPAPEAASPSSQPAERRSMAICDCKERGRAPAGTLNEGCPQPACGGSRAGRASLARLPRVIYDAAALCPEPQPCKTISSTFAPVSPKVTP